MRQPKRATSDRKSSHAADCRRCFGQYALHCLCDLHGAHEARAVRVDEHELVGGGDSDRVVGALEDARGALAGRVERRVDEGERALVACRRALRAHVQRRVVGVRAQAQQRIVGGARERVEDVACNRARRPSISHATRRRQRGGGESFFCWPPCLRAVAVARRPEREMPLMATRAARPR